MTVSGRSLVSQRQLFTFSQLKSEQRVVEMSATDVDTRTRIAVRTQFSQTHSAASNGRHEKPPRICSFVFNSKVTEQQPLFNCVVSITHFYYEFIINWLLLRDSLYISLLRQTMTSSQLYEPLNQGDVMTKNLASKLLETREIGPKVSRPKCILLEKPQNIRLKN